MRNLHGDCFEVAIIELVDAMGVLTNLIVHDGKLSMGGGHARAAADLYPELPELWGGIIQDEGDLHEWWPLQFSPLDDVPYQLVAFPTMDERKFQGSLPLIESCADALVSLADYMNWEKVIIPRPGCGIGGLDWQNEVAPLLGKYWDDRFLVITNDP